MRATWALTLPCTSKNSEPTPYAATYPCCSSIDVPRSSKITTDDKFRTAINTDATPHHHRTLSESVAFLDNIWHVLFTTASPCTLTSFTLCQEKSGTTQVSIGEVASWCGYGQKESELRDVAALSGALEQDVWVVRTLHLTCSLLSGQTPWLLRSCCSSLEVVMHRWSDIGQFCGVVICPRPC
jgi:hypothetical protein